MSELRDADGPPAGRLVGQAAVLLTAIAAGGAVDLALDRPASWRSPHVAFELGFLLLCLGSAAYLARGWWRARRTLAGLQGALAERQAERDAWRRRASHLLQGLGEAIDEQMVAWELTPAERETALFLLKGYSHKQVAELSGRGERTVRQHAVAVYRKSGLGGRAELSAFFLEDLLPPAPGPRAQPPSPGPG